MVVTTRLRPATASGEDRNRLAGSACPSVAATLRPATASGEDRNVEIETRA